MRSKRVFTAQRAAREKEKRKTAKSAVKTENSKKFGGLLFKKKPEVCSFIQKHWPKTNEVSGQRQVNAPLKNFDTKTRTKTKLSNTDTTELNNTRTTELNNETT